MDDSLVAKCKSGTDAVNTSKVTIHAHASGAVQVAVTSLVDVLWRH